ncbi:MAG TPA: hypothetical protein VMH05_18280 [Bryobacteraceae bacterium]|nr:hypothetical protein [Bryobacteraceae bacterium]
MQFFRVQRDYILKEGPPKVGQIISFNPTKMASELYYFESADIPATDTVRRHLQALAAFVKEARAKFR